MEKETGVRTKLPVNMKAGISIVAWSLCNTDMVAVNRLILTSFKHDNLTQSTTRKVYNRSITRQ